MISALSRFAKWAPPCLELLVDTPAVVPRVGLRGGTHRKPTTARQFPSQAKPYAKCGFARRRRGQVVESGRAIVLSAATRRNAWQPITTLTLGNADTEPTGCGRDASGRSSARGGAARRHGSARAPPLGELDQHLDPVPVEAQDYEEVDARAERHLERDARDERDARGQGHPESHDGNGHREAAARGGPERLQVLDRAQADA